MTKRRTAIYDPPKKGFPYVVVCLEGDDAKIVTVSSRQETREIIASQSRKPPGNREPKDAAEVGLVP